MERGGKRWSGALRSETTVRAGGAADRDFVLDLGGRTTATSVSELRPQQAVLVRIAYERLVAFAFAQSHVLLIAETPIERVGFLLMLDELPDEVTLLPQAFVAYMAVEPHARRSGTASKLLRAAEEAARARGLPNLALMVTEDNIAARELYAQAGFASERRLLCKAL